MNFPASKYKKVMRSGAHTAHYQMTPEKCQLGNFRMCTFINFKSVDIYFSGIHFDEAQQIGGTTLRCLC